MPVRGGGTCYRLIPLALFRIMAHMSDWRTMTMNQHRYQNGSLTKRSNRFSEDVWQFRFYETTPEGCRYRKSTSVGTVAQYPTKSDALRFIEPLRIRLNLYHRFGRPVSVGALMDHYV